MSDLSPSTAVSPFQEEELEFARSWELHAPGLGGWTVTQDEDEGGGCVLLVDPPLVYGGGFVVQRDGARVRIDSPIGEYRAGDLRTALLLICPLDPATLDLIDRSAGTPFPIGR